MAYRKQENSQNYTELTISKVIINITICVYQK